MSKTCTLPGWIDVSLDGFASMNAGRPPAHLVKELLQNSLDAIGDKPDGRIAMLFNERKDGVSVICRDNGAGMPNLQDIRTVFYTSKTDSHLKRGRMGRGFKEMLAMSRKASVRSGGQVISFVTGANGERTTHLEKVPVPIIGMVVEMDVPWDATTVVHELMEYFRTVLPPANVYLTVNGEVIPSRPAKVVVEASLPTEVFESGKWLRPSRKTTLLLTPADGPPQVFEMGIPVCSLEWDQPFHVDVQQRVPMNPCRDAVASGYLTKVHRACLPTLLPLMEKEKILTDWVGAAVAGCDEETQKAVISAGFGDNVVRSVPKMGVRQFDEDAREMGKEVVDTRQVSGGFRDILQAHVPTSRDAVNLHTAELTAAAAQAGFDPENPTTQKQRDLLEKVGVERVLRFSRFAGWFCQRLLDGYSDGSSCVVHVAELRPAGAVATWRQDDVLTLGLDTGYLWSEPLGQESLTTLIHEAAHHLNAHHGRDFHLELERLAGLAARLMLLDGETATKLIAGESVCVA